MPDAVLVAVAVLSPVAALAGVSFLLVGTRRLRGTSGAKDPGLAGRRGLALAIACWDVLRLVVEHLGALEVNSRTPVAIRLTT